MNNAPIPPTAPTPIKEPVPQKFDNNRTVLLILFLVIAVAGAAAAAAWGSQQASKLKSIKQEVSSLKQKEDELNNKVTALTKELEDRKNTTGETNINKDGFQSVFLTNGQVYFGKITAISETQVTLENIYYMRDNGGGDISLIKLGSELHGPEDKMFIERKEVQFWENLKDDSQTVKAIKEYEKSNP